MSIGEAGGVLFLGFAVVASVMILAGLLYYAAGGR
jgi:hypothetical protein